MKANPRSGRERGATLVELLAVVTIVGILTAVAGPNLSGYVASSRLAGTANEFVAALTLARGEAILRGAPVVLRRSAATGGDWSAGWEMFIDLDGDGVRNAAAGSGEIVLRSGGGLPTTLTAFSSTAAADGIRFLPNGRARPLAAGSAVFMICHDGSAARDGRSTSRAVLVSESGRVRVAASNSDGYPLNDAAAAITSCTSPA